MNKQLFKPDRLFAMAGSHGLLNWMPDALYLRILYRLRLHKKLSLKNPVTYNEKLQWLKLHDRNPLYTELADKYEVRRYIAETIGGEYLIPLVGGPWNSFDEIDFDALPEQFVLKCTHDSGGVVICRNKASFDREAARRRMEKRLKRNFYHGGREWPYKNITPRIIAEQYMEDDSTNELRDYKFYAFHGELKMMLVATQRQASGEETKLDFFDMEGRHLDFCRGRPNAPVPPELPRHFEQLRALAEKLSKDFLHIRVDLYEANGRIWFGELTFYPAGGTAAFSPESVDYELGSWLHLPH